MDKTHFRNLILDFYKQNARDLPWRNTTNPYHIFISEIMLQQTQVERVIPKYAAFIKTFPSFDALEKSSFKTLLTHWQGLGYNRRALALKRASSTIARDYKGKLPKEISELIRLPGIGPATAGAILTYAFNLPVTFLETNIRRVFLHHFFLNKKSIPDTKLLPFIRETIDHYNPRIWYYALTDYGAHLGKLSINPNTRSAHYTIQSRFKGSNRELRGKIIAFLLEKKSAKIHEFLSAINAPSLNIQTALHKLKQEQFLIERNKTIFFKE